MIVFCAIEQARSRRDALLPASFGALNLRAATAWPSTRVPLALRCGGSIYAVDATHGGAAAVRGTCTKCNFYDEKLLHLVRVEVRLFGSRPRPEPLGQVEDVRPLEFFFPEVLFGGAGLRDTGSRAGVVDGAELRGF
jgi:hypothetical protein